MKINMIGLIIAGMMICAAGFGVQAGSDPNAQKEKPQVAKNDPNTKPADANAAKAKTAEKTQIEMVTSKGTIVIEVDNKNAPITAANFVQYVNEGFFDGTIFHRVIPDFMIQGGGFTKDMNQKKTHSPIKNEASNGLKNERGTLAMARTNDPDSATAQFFINLVNNDFLNYKGKANPGYAVFGKVTKGMEVVDSIAKVKTGRSGMHDDVPVEPVVIVSAKVIN